MKFPLSVAAIALAALMSPSDAAALQENGDPLASARWADMEKTFLGGAPVLFDPRVKVVAPSMAENPMQVPVTVDATALPNVQEVLVFADFNPIVQMLRFYPDQAPAFLGFRVKLQQSTPVRAAVRTADGVWHVGGSWVNTVGGGCTAPSAAAGSKEWQQRLNEVSGRQWSEGPNAGRVRLRIVHPMDTGLVAGTPAFYLEEITLSDAAGKRLMRVQTYEPVSENPVFTLNRGCRWPGRSQRPRQQWQCLQGEDRAVKRWFLLALLCLAGQLGAAEFDYGLSARPVAQDVYAFYGRNEDFDTANGGNIVNTAFIVAPQGIIVIDSGPSLRYGQQMRQAIAAVSDKPVLLVINTHHHPDHFLGNQAFAGLPIGALAATRDGIASEGNVFAENLYRLSGDWMKGTEVLVPGKVLQPGVLDVAGRRLRLLALDGHTGADLVILDETSGVLFAGDLVFNGRAPTTPHANVAHWLAALDQLAGLNHESGFKVLLPGHGAASKDDAPIRQTRAWLTWLSAGMRDAAKAGLDMNDVLAKPLPPQFADLPVAASEYRRSVGHLFPTAEQEALEAGR
jgi:quinoprotein dehydrogenase-associated SoxYZ-like carrier